MRHGLIPGYNVDKVNISAGLEELSKCGYDKAETIMLIEYCLMRHGRGEEVEAQRMAIDKTFFGITLTVWFRVLAAAIVSA